MDEIGIALIGCGFVAEIHADCYNRSVPGARIAAVVGRNEARTRAFAERFGIPRWFTDFDEALRLDEVRIADLCVPNNLHAEMTVGAAAAGKHVICEKPLCMNLGEADDMIAACAQAGVRLMYAEELCFAPKYVRAKQLADEGALGKIYLVKHSEKHFGPHAEWFWDVEKSGGGVMLDMGCHAIEFFRWMLGKPKAVSVYAQMGTHVHNDLTEGDDNSIALVEFEGGAVGMAEESWAKRGGMDDRAEIYGSHGVSYADLLHGNALETYSEVGYGYAVEKAPETKGWTFTVFEEAWNYGFPQELVHFVDCVRTGAQPLETGEDGRAVLEIIMAAYESAATGRRVELPFHTEAQIPIAPWLKSKG
ncbi:MAG: Gfo/Idh/MocA family oxidoreductase [Armatimonadota bacterium]|nr:MAG: Gfo/Idh/MocA family oxidoreductase [Armatimonadota bacterium]